VLVLDEQALVAFLSAEPAMQQVRSLLESGEQTIISSINLAETVDRMLRIFGAARLTLRGDLEELDLHVTGVDADLAFAAAELRAVHYHRTRRPVSLADCIAAALSLDRVARLATSDPHLLQLVLDEGGLVEPLPASDGTTWQG